MIFPEGTRFTPAKHRDGLNFAKEKGLPQLKYHLTPRVKGFTTTLESVDRKCGAIYDVTVTFKQNNVDNSTVTDLMMGRKMDAYLYLKRIPLDEVPMDVKGQEKFLFDLFVQKVCILLCRT